MARSLYVSGTTLEARNAEAYRVAYLPGNDLRTIRINGFVAAVAPHVHYEVSTMANPNHLGVAGSWWIPTGTHKSAEWDKYGGWEHLWWKPDGGEPVQVIDRGTEIVRPSQIFWWIATADLGNLVPGAKPGSVHNSLNKYEGPVKPPG